MADPLSIIGAVGAVANVIELITKSISTIREVRGRWRDAELEFISLASQLLALKSALNKIQSWARSDLIEENDLLDMSITRCVLLMEKFDTFLDDLHQSPGAPLDFNAKVKLSFGTKDLDGVQKMVERQVSALTLLLTASNCKSISEQKALLKSPQSRKIIGRLENDSASLFVHRDTSSLITNWTGNCSRWSVRFDFDGELFVTKVYEKIIRHSLRNPFTRSRNSKQPGDSYSISPSTTATTARSERFENEKRSFHINSHLRIHQSCLSHSPLNALVLGDFTSGKEQILNQMRCASQGGYSVAERMKYQRSIHHTVIGCIKFLLKAMKRMDIAPESEVNRGHYIFLLDHMLNRDENQPLRSNIGDIVYSLWSDTSIDMVRTCGSDLHSIDRVSYFCTHVQRILDPEYVPSYTDIFKARIKSNGFQNTRIHHGTLTFDLLAADLKASRSVKWLYQLDKFQSLIFAIDLSCYDQRASDKTIPNRMVENMALVDRIINLTRFQRTAVIVLFNHVRIFNQKLAISPLRKYFSDFEGGEEATEAKDFLMEKFVQLNQSKGRSIYCHSTDVDDPSLFPNVIGSLKHIIVQSNVRSSVIQEGMGIASCGKEYASQHIEDLEEYSALCVRDFGREIA